MSYARYLAAVNQNLRETVLPAIQTAVARDALENSINIIAAIAAGLVPPDRDALSAIESAALPADLQEAARPALAAADGTGLVLPTAAPPADLALSAPGAALAAAGTAWLARRDWSVSPELHGTAARLVNWEHGLRTRAMARIDLLENGGGAAERQAAQPVLEISAAAIEAYLRDRLQAPELTVHSFRAVSGGRSRQTALFSVAGTEAIPEHLAVQRDHPGAINAFSVATQFPLLQRLYEAGMKVPRPVLVETARGPLGAPFMLAERVSGKTPIPSVGYWVAPPKALALATGLARQMAILHQVPVGDLASVLPHAVQPGQSWHDDIDAIAASWNALTNAPSIAVTGAMTWMKQHADHIGVVKTLVHCDMLLHNILVEDGEVTAVLDWEAAHIGHPGEDVGYVRPVIEQMGVWPQFLEAYYDAGGYRLSQEEIDFFTLLAISRVMNLGQQSREAFDLGRTDDPILADVGAAWIPKMVNRLAGQLVAIVNREG